MLDRKEHEKIMGQILFDISKDDTLRGMLGFKGGTACYFFHNLPRFSVDLDFNLTPDAKADVVMKNVHDILSSYGEIRDAREKYFTLFFLLSYRKNAHQLKVEISTRLYPEDQYEVRSYLGLPVLVLQKPFMTAHKFAAITSRKKMVNRDLFDAHYFLKNNWPIDEASLKLRTGKTKSEYFLFLADMLEKMDRKNILEGIGELIDEPKKQWVKSKLMDELIYLLRLFAK